MRQRAQRRLTDEADVYQREQTGENEIGEPIIEWTLADTLRCRFDDQTAEFVREDSGERVTRPARITVFGDVAVEQGDRIHLNGSEWYEATGVSRTRDDRRGVVTETVIELQESDEPEVV